MVVMHRKTIREYAAGNAQAAGGLEEWYQIVKAADWSGFADLRNDLPTTDLIGGDRFVFNIKGNHYRLLAAIVFKTRTVLIRGIFTHADYSKLSRTQLLTR
ncbi:type II toxin-antitoxin system HigB family toxin [Hymenobacter nivis]|uniref:Type II toxin-antitoxin system HigB family toxin n=1 Tax=Hymenobacter nivis TaxID=1850093 RepID=A0A502HEK0_9BACT|nr:type II toxin-antitoxin system HigB family toxin [Hymenobacter nivis]TPG72444.1 type II toxin-antitoxin system HigB family toxin [Hymenobacter nivis]